MAAVDQRRHFSLGDAQDPGRRSLPDISPLQYVVDLVGEFGLGLKLARILAKPTAVSPGNYSSFQDQGRSLGMEAGEHLFFYPLAVQEHAL